jgi:hypothetical protein
VQGAAGGIGIAAIRVTEAFGRRSREPWARRTNIESNYLPIKGIGAIGCASAA